MKKVLLILIFLLIISNIYASNYVEHLLSCSSNSEITYYNNDGGVDMIEYSRASSIREAALSKGDNVDSIVIADLIEKSSGNEYIELVNNKGIRKIAIHDNNKKIFEYAPKNGFFATKSYVDIIEFEEKGINSKILKYYIINESSKRQHISLYIIRIRNDKIEYAGEIVYYDRIKGDTVDVISHVDYKFVDINGNGEYELILALKQKVGQQKETIEYQIQHDCLKSQKST